MSKASNDKQYKFIKYLSNLFLGISLFLAGFTIILNVMHVNTMYVVSNSMEPAFKKGDLLLVQKNYENLNKGDVVAYRAVWLNNEIVTHRIREISGDDLITKGDNNLAADPSFNKKSVYGKIVAIGPNLGWFFNPYFLWINLMSGVSLNILFNKLKSDKIKKEKVSLENENIYIAKHAIEE